MAKVYYQEDCNLAALEGQKIAIIGYGSQADCQRMYIWLLPAGQTYFQEVQLCVLAGNCIR